jgi:phosphatidylglycerol:prolipoprotein diacylglycerol transferase
MRPFLFNIGDMQVPSFFFMIMVGSLACAFYCYWIAGRVGLRKEIYLDLGMIGMVCGVLGARLFHILVEAPEYYLADPIHAIEFWRGGFVSYGAYIGGTLSVFAYLYLKKLEVLKYIDLLCLGIPLIQFNIRVACVLAGCCYGQPTDFPWAITFSNPASTAHHFFPGIPLHPVQIYSAIHAILLFVGINLFYFKKKNRFKGQCLPVMFIAYFIPRGIIEFWRGDIDRGIWFGGWLSTGQIVGLLGTVFFIFLYYFLKRRDRERA